MSMAFIFPSAVCHKRRKFESSSSKQSLATHESAPSNTETPPAGVSPQVAPPKMVTLEGVPPRVVPPMMASTRVVPPTFPASSGELPTTKRPNGPSHMPRNHTVPRVTFSQIDSTNIVIDTDHRSDPEPFYDVVMPWPPALVDRPQVPVYDDVG